MKNFIYIILLLSFSACNSDFDFSGKKSTGLAKAEKTGGPAVIFDVFAKPLPIIPLPNNAATVIDPTSPTGRRLNVSLEADTLYERKNRAKFNQLDGFGTFAPVFASFDKPLDLSLFVKHHYENDDFRDDLVYVINVDPKCKHYGQEVGLDITKTPRFPAVLFKRASVEKKAESPEGMKIDYGRNLLFDFDDKALYRNMLFEERNEDLNGNGILDKGEDLDQDGTLDVANFIDPKVCDSKEWGTVERDQCVADNLLTWYDREDNTLIMRPIWALEQRCTYAAVITKRVKGEDGKTIESPFEGINQRSQTKELKDLEKFLPRYGLSIDDVAFTWSFKTGSMTHDLEELRKGLYGAGKFSYLEKEFPVDSLELWNVSPKKDQETNLLDGACAGLSLTELWRLRNEYKPNLCALEAELSTLGGVFGGSFKAPDLLVDKDGNATEKYQGTEDESWDIDLMTGKMTYGSTDVNFWCSLPIESESGCSPGNPEGKPFCKPFPTILYAHGYGGSRAEILSGHMGRPNSMGYAICATNAYGHGMNRIYKASADEIDESFKFAFLLFDKYGTSALKRLILEGRDRDLNNDGLDDPGADMWTADLFHTRDMVRQSVLEYIQFVRILRSFDGKNKAKDGRLLGDIDGDGTVDLAGPKTNIGMWGISLGGILAGVVAGAEPGLDATSPNAGGAGLSDIAYRASQSGVPEMVILPMIGPLLVGCLPIDSNQNILSAEDSTDKNCIKGKHDSAITGDTMTLGFFVGDNKSLKKITFDTIKGIKPGDKVRYENLVNKKVAEARVNERGFIRIAVPTDALSAINKRKKLGIKDDFTGLHKIENTSVLGDRIRITILDGKTGETIKLIDTFQRDIEFQGTIYPSGQPLIAIQQGLGHYRNTPVFRRYFSIVQSALSQGDPGSWAMRYYVDPVDLSYDPYSKKSRMHTLVMPTAGDKQVPPNTGIAMARAAGILGSWIPDYKNGDPKYGWRKIYEPVARLGGKSPDQFLLDNYVVEGVANLERFGSERNNPSTLFDADNTSDGKAKFSCNKDSDWSTDIGENGCPDKIRITDEDVKNGAEEVFIETVFPEAGQELRINQPRGDGSFDSLRIPILRPAGQHGIYNSQSFRVFDNDTYMVNFTNRFLGSGGKNIDHEESCDCSGNKAANFFFNDKETFPAVLQACDSYEKSLKVCSDKCNEKWGFKIPAKTECKYTR